jgi:polyketide synthase Type III
MSAAPGIYSIGTANPPNRYTQEEIYNLIAGYSPFYRQERIRQLFMNSDIDLRHFFFDIATVHPNETPDELHRRFLDGAMTIGAEAIERSLREAHCAATDIDYLIVVSCTGYLCPGLTSRLIKELGFRNNIQRADLLGMGCAGAMPGLQRAYDFVRAYPGRKALLLTVEICSACYYIDESLETVVGNAICSDGAAALILGMTDAPEHPKITSFETLLEPSLLNAVGFEQREGKLRIILSKDIRDVAGALAKKVITSLLAANHLERENVHHWILHSGGRKVIDNLKKELQLTDEQTRHSRNVLRTFGNMSSPTVLYVLKETTERSRPQEGNRGVMLAMGPGLALESALVEW